MGARSYQSRSRKSGSYSHSDHSDASGQSRSTAPTIYSVLPMQKHCERNAACHGVQESDPNDGDLVNPRTSIATYASTVPSFDDLLQEPQYDVPEYRHELLSSDEAIPSSPPQFAELFPSTRQLLIRHDDSTSDGNMNLRIDTEVMTTDGRAQSITLFHLRMHDLKDRQFSLRRYCRDSGREVCHTKRKYIQAKTNKRPGLQRSISNALANFRPKSESQTFTMSAFNQHDNLDQAEDDEDEELDLNLVPIPRGETQELLPTNTTRLEFSNYAQVEVKRRGNKLNRRHEFEYWGSRYQWKRESRRDGDRKVVSHHLINATTGKSLAHIVPMPLTRAEATDEESKGGWISPCSFWISDQRVTAGLTDVADVVVATGLTALTDDCIKRRWHSKKHIHLTLPTKTLQKPSEASSMMADAFHQPSVTTPNGRPKATRHRSAF